eukprot:995120_1
MAAFVTFIQPNIYGHPSIAIPLVKVLIYHSYFLFPVQQLRMEQVFVAESLEAKMVQMLNRLKLTKKQKKNQLKQMGKVPPTKHFDGKSIINNIGSFNIPVITESKANDKGSVRGRGRDLSSLYICG